MTALRLCCLLITALSLGPSFAHVLEAPPRLMKWSLELWREATVFNGQYQLFGMLGGPLDGAAVLITALLAFLTRHERPNFAFTLTGALLYLLALIAWATIVAPANSVLATWMPGPLPQNAHAIQLRWEVGHMIVAALKLVGFAFIALSM